MAVAQDMIYIGKIADTIEVEDNWVWYEGNRYDFSEMQSYLQGTYSDLEIVQDAWIYDSAVSASNAFGFYEDNTGELQAKVDYNLASGSYTSGIDYSIRMQNWFNYDNGSRIYLEFELLALDNEDVLLVPADDATSQTFWQNFTGTIDSIELYATYANDQRYVYYIDEVPQISESVKVVCFTHGTLITTDQGERPIEELKAGDLVLCMDHGAQPIRWIGKRAVHKEDLAANPKLYPIRIAKGSLGPNMPERDLLVSRQHRVLVRSKIAERVFGVAEVLVPAVKLLAVEGIEVADDVAEVEYWHFLFDRHQIVFSNGAATESLLTGPEALKSVSAEAREEIATLFPEIQDPDFEPVPVRYLPKKAVISKPWPTVMSRTAKPW